MRKSRRKFSASFKAKVAIEALKERLTIQEIANKFEIHPNQVTTWKKQFLDNAENVFRSETTFAEEKNKLKSDQEELYKSIGKLKIENDFLKKSLGED
jgi:transposase